MQNFQTTQSVTWVVYVEPLEQSFFGEDICKLVLNV